MTVKCNTSDHHLGQVPTPLNMLWFLHLPSYLPPSAILVNASLILLEVLLYFGMFLVGHFFLGLWVCLDWGVIISFFCHSFVLFHFCYSLGVLSLRGCVEIFRHWWVLSRHNANTYKHKLQWTCIPPVFTSPFVMLFVWLSGPQFAWDLYFQHPLCGIEMKRMNGKELNNWQSKDSDW